MTTGERVVTIEQLERLGACRGTLDFLRDRFGETVEITEASAVACAEKIDWDWAAENLLPARMRRKYEEAVAPLSQQYKEAATPLLQQYQEAEAPLRQQYDEAEAPLWQQFEEAVARLRKQFEEAEAPLWQQYRESCARLFISLYNQDKEANPT